MNPWIKHLFARHITRQTRKPIMGTSHRARPHVEVLEDRVTPAVTDLTDGVLTIDLNAIEETLTINNDGNAITLTSTADITGESTFTTAKVNRIVVTNSEELADQLLNVAGDRGYTLSGGFSSIGVEAVLFNRAVNAGGGSAAINVNASAFVSVNPGANLTGGSDGVTIVGGGSSTSRAIGVDVNQAIITMTGNGNVSIDGTGGGRTGINPLGVRIRESSMITSGGAGTVTVTGTGGAGSGVRNNGVRVQTSSTITSGGVGTVTVIGTGGAGSRDNNGVWVVNANSQITSGGGNVNVTGTGGSVAGIGRFNIGVVVNNSGMITSGGMGTVTITGTGGGGAGTDSKNFGVWVIGADSQITSGGSNINVTATGNTDSNISEALRLENSGSITSGNDADITITADSITITQSGTNPLGFINSGTGTTTIRTRTAGTQVDLGGNNVLSGSPLTLGLTSDELNQITASMLQIGDANTGDITISANISGINATDLGLSGASVRGQVSGTDLDLAGGTLSFSPGTVLHSTIDGLMADLEFEQLQVIGSVDVSGLGVQFDGEYVPEIGDSFDLIVASDTVLGQFGASSKLNAVRMDLITTPTTGRAVASPPSVNQNAVALYAVGAGPNGPSTVNLFNPTAASVQDSILQIDAFPGFTGGVRTAVADVNGDGIPDLIVGTGPGIATQVKIFDGSNGKLLQTIAPFEPTFLGGVYVAAGDINGDGFADIVITPDEGGGPRVRIFGGADFSQINDFFGIEDPNFRGGARTTLGDLNADDTVDLIVVAGFGGGPRVAAFNGESVSSGVPRPEKFFPDFFVFEQTLTNGVFVSSGDINGDGFADIVAGGGPGGGPRVLALSGQELINSSGSNKVQLANFFGGDPNSRGGIRIAVKDLDGDTRADLVTGPGTGSGAQLTRYLGKDIGPNGTPNVDGTFDAIPGFTNGIFVG